MADLNVKVGQTIQSQDGRQGVVRYVGSLHIAAGEWLGLELADSSGKNDGSVKGERYFQCQPGHGIFVRKESAVQIVKQPAPAARTNGVATAPNAAAAKPRPSSGVTPDVARKRQSLMGGGTGSNPGSRLSIRQSPTKSPTKAVHSSASSAASTPRTGTPATTTRTSDSSAKSRLSTTGRTSMGPPSAPVKAASHATKPSIGSVSAKPTAPRVSTVTPRQSTGGPRISMQSKATTRQSLKTELKPAEDEDVVKSPTIPEEDEGKNLNGLDEETYVSAPEETGQETISRIGAAPHAFEVARARTTSISGTANGSVESRTAAKREVEQLKATVRTLEKKALENRDKLKSIDSLQSEKDRFEGIIQALQKKLKTNQQEMFELRSKYEDAETRAEKTPDRSAEHESEIELAALDKEMAEERADMYQAELEALKSKHEELELEAEILREENRELGSVMSPEDKASAGWLQMEREQERLRQALILLRDVTQQNESDLKTEVKELQETLDEAEKTASMYEEITEKLARCEESNRHLVEQLEAAETNDEVFEAMEIQREQSVNLIEQLKKQIQDMEEHIQVTDELESFHVEEEKRLHYQLDESEALLNDKHRQATEQEKVIEDLEYTLTKFRNIVQGLQSDIDELRRSRDISELEAHEMSSKSRAMLDLNLQLQNTAAKTQLKAIDMEMDKMHAEQASSHLEIVQLFVPESFDSERNPVLALLCFKRIVAKATLIRNVLSDRMRDRPHLVQDDPFTVFEVVERMDWIASSCDKFISFISTSSPEDFARYSGAPFELEPIERSLTGWVEALRRDELGSDGPEHLQRMIGILSDLAEKLIPENNESKATAMLTQCRMVENYADSVAHQIAVMVQVVQSRLGSAKDEDEDSMVFDKRTDQLGTKARTVKYLCGKLVQVLQDLRSGSMCLAETSWVSFEDAEKSAAQLSTLVREMGMAVMEELGQLEPEIPLSYTSIIDVMVKRAKKSLPSISDGSSTDSIFGILNSQLQSLQGRVDELNNKASDIASAIEFESLPAPWTIRAKEIKAQKIISHDVQEEMSRLKTRAQEQSIRLVEKDKAIEEQQIRVDLLESRAKETKVRDESVKLMKEEVEKLNLEKANAQANLEKIQAEHTTLLHTSESTKAELDALKTATLSAAGAPVSGIINESATQHLKTEIDLLALEITSLQAAVRFLRQENYSLRVPLGEQAIAAAQNTWLDPSHLHKQEKDPRAALLRREGQDVFSGLIELAKEVKPVILVARNSKTTSGAANRETDRGVGKKSAWKASRDTTRFQVAKQREELERWVEWRDDTVKRARLGARTARKGEGVAGEKGGGMHKPTVGAGVATTKKPLGEKHAAPGRVQIVESSP